jgi:hypothetical protein
MSFSTNNDEINHNDVLLSCFGCSSFLLQAQALPFLSIAGYALSAKHLILRRYN